MFKNINRKIFTKLYRYYCRKLLEQGGMFLLMFAFSLLLLFNFYTFLNKFDETFSWSQYVGAFGLISLLQIFGMVYVITNLIARLVGYPTGFHRYRSGKSALKKSSNEDINVLHFTPGADRETLIGAKYAAAATFFFPINFLFYVLPLATYLIISAKISLLAVGSFLLLNGLVFSVVNFFWLVPLLFYFYEGFSFFMFLALFGLFLIATLIISFLYYFGIISQYPLLLPLLFLPLSGIFGYYFFQLYRRKFLKKDLV